MLRYLYAFFASFILFAAPALAQQVAGDGQVVIPWGSWLAQSADVLVTLAGAVLAFALARLPASISATLKTFQVEQLLDKAIGYGVNMVAGAAKDQQLTIPVANKVIETALEYTVSNGSAALINWMGGRDVIEKKIIARLNIVPTAGEPVK